MAQLCISSKTPGIADSTTNPIIEHFCVVDFRQKKESRNTCQMDWVDVNQSGQVVKHHDISMSKCTHILENTAYVSPNAVLFSSKMKEEFPVLEVSGKDAKNEDKKLYTAKSWLAMSRNVLSAKLEMKISKIDNKAKTTFLSIELPAGFSLTIENLEPGYDIKSLELTKDKYDVTLTIDKNSLDGEEFEVVVKNSGRNDVCGKLGVFAFEEILYPVAICALVDENGGGVERKAQNILNSIDVKKMNVGVGDYFSALGIKPQFHISQEYGTYNSAKSSFATYVKNERIVPEYAMSFFESIIGNSEIRKFKSEYKGSILLLTDRESTDKEIPSNQQGTTIKLETSASTTTEGYAQRGDKIFTLFKGLYDNYAVCAHELGHNLGCGHTFLRSDEKIDVENSISTDKLRLSKVTEFIEEYEDKQNVDNAKSEQEYLKSSLKSESTIMYSEQSTSNIMDYSSKKKYFFKWQWMYMRQFANKHKQ